MGLRFLRSYLHDGRAQTIEEAILMHAGPGSEANDVVAAFEHLTDSEKNQLLTFVSEL